MERQEISGPVPDLIALVDHVVNGGAPLELTRNSVPIVVISPVRKPVPISELNELMSKAPRLAEGDADQYLKDIREAFDQFPQEPSRWES